MTTRIISCLVGDSYKPSFATITGKGDNPKHMMFNFLFNLEISLSVLFTAYMGVSKNRGTPKSSILIGFSIINHPFWDTPIFGNTHITLQHHTLSNIPYFFQKSSASSRIGFVQNSDELTVLEPCLENGTCTKRVEKKAPVFFSGFAMGSISSHGWRA